MNYLAFHWRRYLALSLMLLLLLPACQSTSPAPTAAAVTSTPFVLDAAAYNDKGLECASKGDYECALTNYQQAILLKPEWADPYDNRGLAYAAKGD